MSVVSIQEGASRMAQAVGRFLLGTSQTTGFGLMLLGRAFWWLRAAWRRHDDILRQMHFCGVQSLLVTLIVAVFTGMILGLQAGIELSRFQQQAMIGRLVAATMCREMGPFMTGLILAACVGSAMAAELGTMKVSEEIDALEVMSVNPYMYLVMPRVLALTVMCPILTCLSDLIGIAGGSVVGRYRLGVAYNVYWEEARYILDLKDVYTGLFKAMVFGTVIAAVGCTQGML
ncbi:MAG: ABC transporter permease, partial [Planctomycetes bacterium]|nr:ABC transporter permease [Planctomycetota bacterium]